MVVEVVVEMVVVGWVALLHCLLVNVKIISIEKKVKKKKKYLVTQDVTHLKPSICPPSVV